MLRLSAAPFDSIRGWSGAGVSGRPIGFGVTGVGDIVTWQRPAAKIVWQAIDLFLAEAYDGPPPAAVRARLDTLRALPPEAICEAAVFEHDRGKPDGRLCLRLGNRSYPHMKLAIEPTPNYKGYLLRADAHDQHVQPPPRSRDGLLFAKLTQENREIATKIESAWEQAGLPTFKQYLKSDLSKRAGAGN